MEDVAVNVYAEQFAWAVSDETVRVTVVNPGPDTTTVLVERLFPTLVGAGLSTSNAVVVTYDVEGAVYLNGVFCDLGDDLPAWCGLSDSALMAPDCGPGSSVVTYAEDEVR